MKLRKGDSIIVTTGKDKKKKGVIDRVYPNSGKILIKDINMYKRHVKKNDQMPTGGIVDLPRPLDGSKVALVCPKCKKQTRIGYEVEGKLKFRRCKKCGQRI